MTSRSKLQTTTQKTPKRRDSKAQILLDRLSNSFIRGHVQSSHHGSEDSKSSKHETKANSKSDRHIEYFETSTPNRTTRRKSQRLSSSHEVKEESKSSQSKTIYPVSADPVDEKVHGKTRKESLKDLFGTDDENSLFGSPDKISAKRRHSATRDKSDDRKKQKVDSAAHEERAFKDIVSTKRRSKSKTRDKIGVPAEGFPKKEKSNSELNVPIVVDSSSEEAPMPSVQLVQPIHKKAAKKTRTEKCQTSELEATVKTIPEVNDKAPRATSKRSSKEIIIDLSAEEELPKNTTIQKPVAESINAENSPVPDLTDKSKHFPTDQRVCGDQSSLQNPTPMDVSSSSFRLQPDEPNALLEESFTDVHVIENIKSTLSNESSQEIQPDKKLVESHQPTKETPEIYEESSRAQLQTIEQEQDESQRSLITSRRVETGVTEVQELQEGLPFDYSNQRSDTQIIEERPALSPSQLQAAPIASTEQHQHDQQNVLSEGSLEIETNVAAKVAAEGPEDLSSKSPQIDRQEPKASKDQQIVDVPSYESERSSTVTECMDVPACPPNELEHVTQASLPETHQVAPPPEKVTTSDPSESQQRQTPQVIVYSNKYGEYRIEDNNESEITIYVTRKKRRSRKSLPASTEVSSSSIVVE
ncbi:AAEL004348-PA [Aedes aegypti]|uniref:AAEL004348-PA n=1 Tax=Aedes aegypti TaxID=7159 RepID=Q17D47_AEDAE|nr:AAEL004348-PA [Aedes aegypti]